MKKEKLLRDISYNSYFITPIYLDTDGKEETHYALHDGRGTLYSKSDLTDLLNKIKSFYELENIEELVNQENKLSYLEIKMENYAANYSRMVHRNENGLYEMPEPDFKYKPFKPEKRHWSCKCHWCGEKVSSKEHKGYYTLNNRIFDIHFERACSEICAKLIWKDKLKEWIFDNKYQDYFVL